MKSYDRQIYKQMIVAAIRADETRKGLSRQGIIKYMMDNLDRSQVAKALYIQTKPVLQSLLRNEEMHVCSRNGNCERYKLPRTFKKFTTKLDRKIEKSKIKSDRTIKVFIPRKSKSENISKNNRKLVDQSIKRKRVENPMSETLGAYVWKPIVKKSK
ncbi:hypothetical protein GJ496_011773 [Pomphorhynchus laevis]|nr:hypothetical protein GJ496_011773 [Pomphorhynchus laevis]